MSCFLKATDHEGIFCVENDLPVAISIEGVDLGAAIVLTAAASLWVSDDGNIDEHIHDFMMDMDSNDDPTRALALPYLQLRRPDRFCYFTVRFCGDVALTSVKLPAGAHVRVDDEVQYGRLLARVTSEPGKFVGRVAAVDLVGVAQVCGADGTEVRAVFVGVEDALDEC